MRKVVRFTTTRVTGLSQRIGRHLKQLYRSYCEVNERRLFSLIQPTGEVHLGNYLGAVVPWVKLQEEAKCFRLFGIADLHSLTSPTITIRPSGDPSSIYNHSIHTTAVLLACGIDPQKSTLFRQSRIPEHTELLWILSSMVPLSRLFLMHQYKSKAKEMKTPHLGILSYPVLMAADILLYKSHEVPVGDDQRQHIELAREIATNFNRTTHSSFFPIPQGTFGEVQRVMSLDDASIKMSKSRPVARSRISLLDSEDVMAKHIRKAKTDAMVHLSYDCEERPEVANLLRIYSALSHQQIEEVIKEFDGKSTGVFKQQLADLVVSVLSPIREELLKLLESVDYIESVLEEGEQSAHTLARGTIEEVKTMIGLHQ